MWDTSNGRSVETVLAELRAIESRTSSADDPGLHAHIDRLRREHEEARRARQRAFEEDLMTVPEAAHLGSGVTPGTEPPTAAG